MDIDSRVGKVRGGEGAWWRGSMEEKGGGVSAILSTVKRHF